MIKLAIYFLISFFVSVLIINAPKTKHRNPFKIFYDSVKTDYHMYDVKNKFPMYMCMSIIMTSIMINVF